MDTKFIILRALDILGISWGTMSIFTVINNTKEAILFIMVVLYAVVRLYYVIRFNENRLKREAEELRKGKTNGHHQHR